MTYEITLSPSVYRNWKSYIDWDDHNQHYINVYSDWLTTHYPEILTTAYNYHVNDALTVRTFTFKSEAHYTWFLLQQ